MALTVVNRLARSMLIIIAHTQMLLDRGAYPHAATTTGSTPLLLACERGHLDTMKLIIAGGADLEASNAQGFRRVLPSCAIAPLLLPPVDRWDELIGSGEVFPPRERGGGKSRRRRTCRVKVSVCTSFPPGSSRVGIK